METFKVDNFTLTVTQDHISIKGSGPGGIDITPGEHANFRELVSVVWRMSSLPAMPDQIPVRSFTAKISANGDIEIVRAEDDFNVKGLHLTLSECDSLVSAVDAGVNKSMDMKSLNPSPRGTGVYVPTTDAGELF